LVTEDRRKLLAEMRRANPAAFMVSVDPSDGEGTCACDQCAKLGTTTDRVFHLANEVAKGLRQTDKSAWVGLYAYSSHRLPATIDVEPNVYVQVAMGFNRTKYTLPELVDAWSKKVGAVGLREYYGVEAWDWGLPGRMRGARVEYHQKWIPFYADRKLNALNAETNANWGAQTVGLYVSSQLLWNPKANVDTLENEFYQHAYGDAAPAMRRLHKRFDEAPPLRAATLLPMFHDVEQAWQATDDSDVRARLVDLMAYLTYVAKFRAFDLVRSRNADRNDEYYESLTMLMNYAWRIRQRDMVHYYALARRLCNGLPVQDKRLEHWLFNKERDPVWMHGDALTDAEMRTLFEATIQSLEADGDPTVAFSRYFEPIKVDGDDGGASSIVNDPRPGVGRFRRALRGFLVPSKKQTVQLHIAPTSRQAKLVVYLRGDTVLYEKDFRRMENEEPVGSTLQTAEFELPKANEYRVELTGDFILQVPEETPFVFEASVTRPAWIDYSGPHYFYVPRGTKELIVDANPRLSLIIPGRKPRLDVLPADRVEGKKHIVVPVPEGAAGKVWRTSNMTRGEVSLLNTPPLFSFHRHTLFTPREIAEADELTTK